MSILKVTQIEEGFSGCGHKNITIIVTGKLIDASGEVQEVEDHELKCTSNNTMASDSFFDDTYDEGLENEDSYYETRHEAGASLVDEVFRKNNIDSDYQIEGIPTAEEVKEMREQVKAERSS